MVALHKIAMSATLFAAWTISASSLMAQTADISSLSEENSSEQSEEMQRGRIESSQDGESMIGPNADNIREVIRELQGTQGQRRNLDMSVENLNRRRSSRRRRARQSPPPSVHVQFQPSFNFPRLAATQVATGVQSRLTQLLEARNAGSVQVSVDGRTATLSGTVRSEYERGLLEKLARIEPGISTVENRIAIEAPQLNPAK